MAWPGLFLCFSQSGEAEFAERTGVLGLYEWEGTLLQVSMHEREKVWTQDAGVAGFLGLQRQMGQVGWAGDDSLYMAICLLENRE